MIATARNPAVERSFRALRRGRWPASAAGVIASAAAAAAFACASPTLPLPPPGYPSLGPGADADHVVLVSQCGGVEPWAVVVIINENTALPSSERGTVSFADGCGAWAATVFAHNGDWLEIWQESDTSRSTSVAVPVSLE